jgi:hypothetical protein
LVLERRNADRADIGREEISASRERIAASVRRKRRRYDPRRQPGLRRNDIDQFPLYDDDRFDGLAFDVRPHGGSARARSTQLPFRRISRESSGDCGASRSPAPGPRSRRPSRRSRQTTATTP